MDNHNFKFNGGFSLIELLLVIALISIIGTFTGSFYARFFNQNAVANTEDQLAGDLRKAQIYSLSGKASGSSSNWGVNFTSPKITLYKGASFATRTSAFDETFSVNSNITTTPSTFDVNFARLTGLPSSTTSIVITGPNSVTKTITINSQGVVSK